MIKLNNIVVIIVLITLIGWGLLNIRGEGVEESTLVDSEIGLNKGNIAPDFELESLDGEVLRLSDFRGKKVIINLWATWCPPCRAEMPHMQDFYQDYKDKGVIILAVNLSKEERNSNAVRPFVEDEFKLTFPVLLDKKGEIGTLYRAVSIPTTYFIDTKGKVQNKAIGPMSYEMLETTINSID